MTRLILMFALWSGCAGRPLDLGSPEMIPTDCNQLASMSDSDFFRLFVYQYPVYQALQGDQPLVHDATNDAAHPVMIDGKVTQLWLNLFAGGKYRASYNELTCDAADTMCGSNDPSVVVGGDWHTSQGELFLDGLGQGMRVVFRNPSGPGCVPEIAFVYSRDLISPGLTGQQELLLPADAATSDEGLF